MILFLGGLALLVVGYFTYGRLVERIVGPDDRKTPAVANPDGVDYVELPKWKNMLIQLLNIAGPGPVIGAIAGVKFGRVAFVIIPLGCILLGAVHDFVHGMVSLRSNGANLPQTVRENLGGGFARGIAWLVVVLLLLATAVMVNVPATLIDRTYVPDHPVFWWSAVVIFAYYIVATLFPVDAIIGRIYPFFGAVLLVGSAAMLVMLVWNAVLDPSILQESEAFLRYRAEAFDVNGRSPIFPILFVTIACGIASGAHATQTPIVARTLRSEREARAAFYGMMIAEGVIAMIWAAAALTIYNIVPENLSLPPAQVLANAVNHHLGRGFGMLTVAGVIILIITSGDTGLRSLRMIAAEAVGVEQKTMRSRILVVLPLVAVIALVLWWSNANPSSFGFLWNYFAWLNQTLVAVTLMACTVWLLRAGKGWRCAVTLLPGMFYTTVVTSFILWTSSGRGQPWGFGLPIPVAVSGGAVVALVFAAYVLWRTNRATPQPDL